jgi:HemY protein
MRSLFWLLTLAALAIGVALLGRLSDGYVLWVVPPWRVELSLNLFVLAQLATLLVVYLLMRAIVNTLDMPRVVAEFRARRARHAAAAAALDLLSPKERRQISAQRLALRLAQGEGDWAAMLRITRLLEKHRALTPEQAMPLRLRAHRGMLESLQDDAPQLVRYWQTMTHADRLDLGLAQRAARALNAAGSCGESAVLIEDYLDERWESALLEDYARCSGGDLLGRIAHCEKWLHEHPDDAALLLALGRLCAQRQLWGKAQSYLEASLAVRPTRGAHVELAQLCDGLGRAEEANRHYRAAARL